MKDKTILRNFWKLYGAGLLHHPVSDFEPMTDKQWLQLRKIAYRSKLYGVVLDGISYLPAGDKPSEKMLAPWALETAKMSHNHWENNRVIADLFHRWHQAGLHPVLLKGQGYARMYHTPSLRMIGDIDVFVCVDEFDRAMEVVRSLPLDNNDFPDIGKHIEFFYRGKGIELHRRSAEIFHRMDLDHLYQQWSEDVLPQTAAGFYIDSEGRYADSGEWIATPPLDFNIFYTFLHLWGHIYTGPMQVRPVADWVLILKRHKGEYDVEALERRLRQFDLLGYWQWVAYLAVKYMGVDSGDIPFYDESVAKRAEKLFKYIHKELFASYIDNFGERNFKRKWHNVKYLTRHNLRRLRVFPTKPVLREYFFMMGLGLTGLFKGNSQKGE